MMLKETYKKDLIEQIQMLFFDNIITSVEQKDLLLDQYGTLNIEKMWPSYQKSVEEYGISPRQAAIEAIKSITEIHLEQNTTDLNNMTLAQIEQMINRFIEGNSEDKNEEMAILFVKTAQRILARLVSEAPWSYDAEKRNAENTYALIRTIYDNEMRARYLEDLDVMYTAWCNEHHCVDCKGNEIDYELTLMDKLSIIEDFQFSKDIDVTPSYTWDNVITLYLNSIGKYKPDVVL